MRMHDIDTVLTDEYRKMLVGGAAILTVAAACVLAYLLWPRGLQIMCVCSQSAVLQSSCGFRVGRGSTWNATYDNTTATLAASVQVQPHSRQSLSWMMSRAGAVGAECQQYQLCRQHT